MTPAPALYNEIDAYAAQWTRNLASAGEIAPGEVDTRSILDLRSTDVAGRTQFHAFSGIAGWSLALRLAGWPDDVPVWTGSCPCQPFSAAGQRKGFDDERHLWPGWFRLIRECRPPVIFGEQVAAAAGHGWLDAVFSGLEAEGYACGAAVLGAHSVGAPHIRQRLWFVAHTPDLRRIWRWGRMARDERAPPRVEPERFRDAGLLADVLGSRLEGRDARPLGDERAALERGGAAGFWSDADWLPCRDGKARPTQPGLFPLAHGIPGRVGRLRAYGNAIVPQVAAAFIGAFMESLGEQEEKL